ncbi:MAG: hypothetical protein E6Q50_09190 [Lysobacter sp.]|nr:MAG: hypothetical protein E6Q50_09190 [Lysobacter sp.]
MTSPSPQTVEDLGLQGCVYLSALLQAQDEGLGVTPTDRLTLATMAELKGLGVIDVPWPENRWNLEPRAEITPAEGFQWRYAWSAYARNLIGEALEEYLQSIPRDELACPWRTQLWQTLSVAETEQYFEQQLVKHRFEASWAQDIVLVHQQRRPALSIARWRYCCWAAVRHGASVSQQQATPDTAVVRDAIYSELRRRADQVASGAWPNCSFPPSNPRPTNALGRLFVEVLSRVQDAFWTIPASDAGFSAG